MFHAATVKPALTALITGLLLTATAHAEDPISVKEIGSTCLLASLDDCKVLSAGFLNVNDYGDNSGAPHLAWQIQTGSSQDFGAIGGFVLLHYADGWNVADSGFDGYFQLPRLNNDGLLHIPGYGQGTAVMNADRLYQLDQDGQGLAAVDMDQWRDTIADKLPAGLGIWKGVNYDFADPWSGYVARTALWNDDDANCCPSGGSAVIALTIEDHVLVAGDVVVSPPEAETTAQ